MSSVRSAGGFAISGASGVVLAGLVYVLAASGSAALSAFVPSGAEPFIFVVLLALSLAEIPVMVMGIRTLARQQIRPAIIYFVSASYVAFAGVYSAVLIVLCGQSTLTILLAGLCAARWASVFAVRPHQMGRLSERV